RPLPCSTLFPYTTLFRSLDLGVQFGGTLLELRVELGGTLLELRIEPREVQLVQLPKLAPIGRIHLIEPIHELVGELVAEPLVERSEEHTSELQSQSNLVC